ncbi:2Fe-2S iron-sulfur cluster-binding protein [Halalkalirubrum salinum]|uniref:2Fe-2S iron-sulfur cluster-binding protein n=1 Tax=Halalkalirubrum salinum TaxID=2563889 RepID=UPI0010FB4979|nr:2Fe-2S iron-sulfur cluster-binding protein [Halalkalirubrum salinum]
MPTVEFRGKSIECEEGEVLRDVLKREGLSVYNGKAKTLNCHGMGSCGTCAVRVDGDVSEKSKREAVRLLVPPHHPNYRLRLSCQTKVLGDVKVEKYPGAWGTDVGDDPLGPIDEE